MNDLVLAARHHYERWDGCGYPDQLAGEQIPLAACIIAVAGTCDAMQRDYPSQQPCSTEVALSEIRHHADNQFDPTVVQALSTMLAEQQKQVQALQSVG
jgi:putative two-component system response regulator